MKQLTVISGKGGTGKTSITAALASLAEKIVVADCDVDAADLHLIMKPDVKKTMNFQGLKIAEIDKNLCGLCISFCVNQLMLLRQPRPCCSISLFCFSLARN